MRRSSRLSTSSKPRVSFITEETNIGGGLEDTEGLYADRKLTPEEDLHEKCAQILGCMRQHGLTLGEVLVAVCFGNPASRQDSLMQAARASVYHTPNLKIFLENSYTPPRPPSGGGKRPAGGTAIITEFAASTMRSILRDELERFSIDFQLTNDQLANIDYISKITSESLYKRVKKSCPMLHSTLESLTSKEFEQSARENDESDEDSEDESDLPPGKHPHFGTVVQIAALAYRLNPQKNLLQKILGVYLKAKHTSKAAFYVLHQCGFTVSYATIQDMISNLSLDLRLQMILAAKSGAIVIFHDNIRLKYGVSSQRGDNQSVTDNGTAASVLVLPPGDELSQALEDPDDWGPALRVLVAQRLAGTAPKLCWQDLNKLDRRERDRKASIFDILEFLRAIPELAKHKIWDSEKLRRPKTAQQIPYGKELRMKQYMLPTTNIDESSYSGNSQVIPYVLKQLGLDTSEESLRLALERRIIWVGDQMTAQRCRQVQYWRLASRNSLTRWQPFAFIFGGFHTQMTLGAAVLETFRGANVGASLGSDIILLSRAGLEKKKGKKRHNYHDVDELLLHEAEAHFRGLFGVITGCKTEEQIVNWAENHTAENLYELAETIYKYHASSGALERLEVADELRPSIILRTRDLLLYYSLQRAFKHGDIGRFEDLLPELLFYFIGSGHSLYAKEVMEFLQLIWHESTPKIKAAILRHGILVNKQGRSDSFYPIDLRQEHNNAGIREYGPPPQNSSWEQYGKISSIIPLFQDIVSHVESLITGLKRSHIHKNPKHEKDVCALIERHYQQEIHENVPGRIIQKENKAKDVIEAGIQAVCEGNTLKDFHKNRDVYFKRISTEQTFDDTDTPPRGSSPML